MITSVSDGWVDKGPQPSAFSGITHALSAAKFLPNFSHMTRMIFRSKESVNYPIVLIYSQYYELGWEKQVFYRCIC
ncbi:hypothetical protein BYT27DRAFT_7195951 [Phlegmacium glaucopus]|nr:hypothetical protein BYT27DRAFT_7195951 [Phlegmacium glaucopus]